MKAVQRAHRGTYVVSYDVANRLQTFRPIFTVPRPNNPVLRRFEEELLEKIRHALPNVAVIPVHKRELQRDIQKGVEGCLGNRILVTTCPEIVGSNPERGLFLHVNRLFDQAGNMLGHGPRPGHKPLEGQLGRLARKIDGRSVVLAKEGAFSGGTCRFVLQEFKRYGIEVKTLIIGFCCTKAKTTIEQVFDGEFVVVNPISNLIDWISDHDLIPFMPNCGRVLGRRLRDGLVAVRTSEGLSLAYPYIQPFGHPEKWVSLPRSRSHEVSKFCLDVSIEIFGRLKKRRGLKATVGELLRSNPWVPLPVSLGDHQNPPLLNMRVVDFLEQARRKLG